MINRTTKLRMRRKFRRGRRQVEDISIQAEEHLDKNLIRRLPRLFGVRRFVTAWLLLLTLLAGITVMQTRALSHYYEDLVPVPGGTYAEGMVGNFTNASPIYATGLVDSSVSRLLFSGLLKYDANNNLVGDLAEKWTLDESGKTYTVTLKPDLHWHDGQTLTADDVAFTFQTIQNPDAGSPLFASWRGITIKSDGGRSVTFTLSNEFAPFIYSLTTGIVPKHSLKDIQPAQLRSALFNTASPIGSGPFKWETIELLGDSTETRQQNIGLTAYDGYHTNKPALQRFLIKTYADEAHLLAGFKKQEVNALIGLDHTPDDLLKDNKVTEFNISLTAETMAFLKNDSELLKDTRTRQAMVYGLNVESITRGLSYPVVIADEPLLRSQLGYNPVARQLPTSIEQAKKLLDEAGWKMPQQGQTRTNGTTKLELKLIAQNNTDNIYITQQLQKAWQALGISVNVTLLADTELQVSLKNREYDVLLYGISIGIDPDVFAYWHSSQADPLAKNRLNFSNYKSSVADKALESGRSRSDPTLRAAKYLPFLQAWRNDVPAIALYQPRFLYVVEGPLAGFTPKTINAAADRYANVENWMVRQGHSVKAN